MLNFKKAGCLVLTAAVMLSALSGCKNNMDDYNFSDEVYTTSSLELLESGGGVGGTTSTTTGSKPQGSGKDNSDVWSNAAVDAPDRNIKDPLAVDLKGKTIIIYGSVSKPDPTASKSEQARAEMFDNIQKKMNCKIEFKTATYAEAKQQALLNSMSDTYFADLILSNQYAVVNFLTSKLSYNLKNVETLSLNEGYMNAGDGVNAFHLGNGYWAVNDAYSLCSAGHVIYVNKRIMKEVTGDENYGYKLMKQNKWNISNFRDLNKKATKELTGDGKMTAQDQWGLIQIDIGTAGFSAIMQTCGAQMILNNNGILKYNMEDKKCLPAINLGVDLYYKDNACLQASDNDAVNLFMSGHGLFLGSGMGYITKLGDMKDDFGILPYPRGDSSKDYSVATNWNCTAFMMPATLSKERANAAGAFLQAYCYSVESLIKGVYKEWGVRYLRDTESVDNLWIGYTSQVTTMANAISADAAIMSGTYQVCYKANQTSPATTIAENKAQTIKALEDLNKLLK